MLKVWSFYYYKIGVLGGKDSQAVGRARAGGGKEGVRSLWVVKGGGGEAEECFSCVANIYLN